MRTYASILLTLTASCAGLDEVDAYRPMTARRAGVELRGYPAGLIAAAHSLQPLGERDAWHVSAGVNLTDRRDWGEHDDESGVGSGLGAGWRRYATSARDGLFWGARFDVFALEIDWEEDDGREGTTDVLVFMPTVEAGRAWVVGGPWVIEAGLGAGAEINFDTDGEDVGDGAIVLGQLGISAGF